MKVFMSEKEVIDSQISFESINFNEIIDNGESILLRYDNRSFIDSIKALADDVIKEARLSWNVPDYKKSKAYFYITDKMVELTIEVFPKTYSAKEKQVMFQCTSQEAEDDEYIRLMNMFDDIDEILNCNFPIGEMGVYSLELTKEENRQLLLLLNKG